MAGTSTIILLVVFKLLLLMFLCLTMPAPRWGPVGRKNGLWMCPCAGKTVRSGGQTATILLPANPTGTAAGTGVRVSGTDRTP